MAPREFCFLERLSRVQVRLSQEAVLKPWGLENILRLDMDELDYTVNPAIVLAVSRVFPAREQKAEALAEIIQLVYMANKIHKIMRDDCDLAEELRQYPVLVGDLLYGRFFLALCQEELLAFLDPLAQVMGTMSEGGISRWLARDKGLSASERRGIIERECASLTALAARLSVELAGGSLRMQHKMEAFGRNLGLAWGAWKEPLELREVQGFLKETGAVLKELAADTQLQIHPLWEVYHFMVRRLDTAYALQEAGA